MLKTKDYIKSCFDKHYQYIDDIEKGIIISNKYIKQSIKIHKENLKRKDLIVRKDKIEKVFQFFSLLRANINNEIKQYELLPYQCYIIFNLFGFYFKDNQDKRKYNYFFLFVGRKNAKTYFATALNLYFLIADGTISPQVLLLASTTKQSGIALDYAKDIIINSPSLRSRVDTLQYIIRFRNGNNIGVMRTLASLNTNNLDGFSPSSVILDEVHTYRDSSIFDAIKSGLGARKNPMVSLISTAGFSTDSFCFELVELSKKLLSKELIDDSFFTLLYTLDDEDDINDYKNWQKSNPSLGYSIHLDYLLNEYNQSKNLPSLLPSFLTKNLNIFSNSSTDWIPDLIIKNCNTPIIDEEKLKSLDCFIGIDLSSTQDMTSIVLLFNDNGKFYTIPYFFIVGNEEKKIRKGGLNLQQWIDKGYIIEFKTKTIDYDYLFEFVGELSKKYNINCIGYDKWNSSLLIPKIENEYGINCVAVSQTPGKFNFPLKYLEKMIFENQISLSSNPVIYWNFRNVVLGFDNFDNIKLLKNKKRDSIDGVVSLAMAMALYLDQNSDYSVELYDFFNQINK